MSNLTDTFENRVMTWLYSTSAVTRPTTWHLALFTVAPTDSSAGTEVSGGSYARQSFTPSVSGSQISLASAVEWPAATANWGNVVAVGIMDASSGGNLISYFSITSQTVNSGNIFRLTSLTQTAD